MESQQTTLWAVLILTFILATICIFLRFLSRYLTKQKLWLDDYLALACYGIALIYIVLIPHWIQAGIGLHIQDITWGTIDEVTLVNKKFLFFVELCYAHALFLAKVSILAFYWRMFKVSNIKLPIQILAACSIIWILCRILLGIFHCIPVQRFWDKDAGGQCVIDDSKFFFGTGISHVLTDIMILALPVLQIRNLKLPLKQRIGVMAMFLFGIFICISATAIVVDSVTFDASNIDFPWNICNIIVWASAEVNLVTVSTCLPTILPAVSYIIFCGRRPQTTQSYASDFSRRDCGHTNTNKSTRMGTIARSDEQDEASSTYELSGPVFRAERGDNEFHDSYQEHGTRTTIGVALKHGQSSEPRKSGDSMQGISVKNETVIQISSRK